MRVTFHSCALDDSGVVCWGSNSDGQTTVPALNNPVAVSAGYYHTCALDDSGVVCWGAGKTNTGSSPEFGQSIVPALSFDRDLDGLLDDAEDSNGNGVVDAGETNPWSDDSDSDGLLDGEEDSNGNGVIDAGETDPRNSDSDNDGLTDGYEVNVGSTDPITVTQLELDSDGDGLTDYFETNVSVTDPYTADAVYTGQTLPDLGDMNGDGQINVGDLLLLQRQIMGL